MRVLVCGEKRSKRKPIAIDFACNDPDNGEFAGRVALVSFDDCELDDGFQERRFTVGDDWIRVHRKKFKFRVRKVWFGNWCWDRFWFERAEGVRLLKHLAANGWRGTGGPVRLSDWFDRQGGGQQ